jgi:S1-C subfamily serine protease
MHTQNPLQPSTRIGRPSIHVSLAVALAIAAASISLRADEVSDKGREILSHNQHAVVTIEVVQKMSARGRSSEAKQEITGTVLDSSGLTAVALSACDPTELYRRVLPDEPSRAETEISDLKILLDDGTELPSEIVLRDKDLDLAFVRPKTKPANSMTAVDFAKSGSAQVLDQVITLNRLNPAASRAYAASIERITAVIQRPRTFYVPDSTMTVTGLGSPVFALNGDVLGLIVMRAVAVQGGAASYREGLTTVILPAADILKGAKQAPESKGEGSDKKDAPKGDKEESKDAK